jgi:hypothetical protein
MNAATLPSHEVLAALAELGVFKPGEEARLQHAHGCRYRDRNCTCPGGPELAFADWDELVPSRELLYTPERFYVRH